MIRHLQVYFCFIRFAMSRAMEFRVDFLLRILMDVMYFTMQILFFKTILIYTDMVGGWSEPQLMVFIASFLLVDSLSMAIFSNNNHAFPRLINEGRFDYYLVRPVSSLFMATMQEFAGAAVFNLLLASGIMVWVLVHYGISVSILQLMIFALCIGMGVFIRQAFAVLIMYIIVFWSHSASGPTELCYSLERLSERPDQIFKVGGLRVLFTTVLPYSLVASFPARVLVDGGDGIWSVFLTLLTVTLVLGLIVGSLWKVAVRAYSSASS